MRASASRRSNRPASNGGTAPRFPFLGEQVIVVLDPRHAFDEVGAVLNTDGEALPGVPRLTLHVGLPHNAQPRRSATRCRPG